MTDINARDEEGQTQLHRAADAGDCDEVTRLLTDKADPELKDNRGFVRPRSFSCGAVCDANTILLTITYFFVKSLVLQIYAASHCLVERKRESCTRVDRRTRES